VKRIVLGQDRARHGHSATEVMGVRGVWKSSAESVDGHPCTCLYRVTACRMWSEGAGVSARAFHPVRPPKLGLPCDAEVARPSVGPDGYVREARE